MDFEELRAYIANAGILPKAKLATDKRKKFDAIFLCNKPKEIEADNFIVYSFNELNGGKTIRQFLITLKVCGNDITSVINLKDSLIQLLNFYDRPCEITRYSKLVFSNEGGIFYDTNTEKYIDNLYFECKLL